MTRAMTGIGIVAEVLRVTAAAGKRCPTNWELETLCHVSLRTVGKELRRLTAAGIISIEISGHNWRTVTILSDGSKTAPDPHKHTVYRRLDAAGDHWLTLPPLTA